MSNMSCIPARKHGTAPKARFYTGDMKAIVVIASELVRTLKIERCILCLGTLPYDGQSERYVCMRAPRL